MFNRMKNKIAVLLAISMVFSSTGFATLASSGDAVVDNANTVNSNYQKEDELKKLLGVENIEDLDQTINLDEPEEEEPEEYEPEEEEPKEYEPEEEETTLAEPEEIESSEVESSEVESSEVESSETTETSELSETNEPTTTQAVETESTLTTVTETDFTLNAESTTETSLAETQNNQKEIVATESTATGQDKTDQENANTNISTDSEIFDDAISQNEIATDSEIVKPALEKELSTASDTEEVNESTQSNTLKLVGELASSSDALFGAGDKYILPANWTKGSGITKKRIDKIEILYYGKDAPAWYNISWNIEGSNGLRAYKKSSYIYIWASEDKDIYLAPDASYTFSGDEEDRFSELTSIDGLDHIYTSDTTNMSHMFDGASRLLSIDATNFDTRNVTDTSYMFNGCNKLNYIYATDLFDVSNVTNSEEMFRDCVSLKSKEMNGDFDELVYDATKTDKERAFCKVAFDIDYGGSLRRKYNNNGYFTDNNYRITGNWFDGITGGNKDDVITIRFDKYNDPIPSGTKYILPDSYGLAVYYDNATATFHPDKDRPIYMNGGDDSRYFADFYNLTSFENLNYLDTSHAATFKYAFASLRSLETIDVSSFVTNHITSLYGVFEGCTNLKEINGIGKWDTGWVWVSSFAFKNCSSLKELDLGNLYYHIYDTTEMYNLCTSLATIYVNNRNFSAIAQSSNNMFNRCDSLIGGQGSRLTWGTQTNFWSAQIDGLFGRSGFYTEYRLVFRPGWYEPEESNYPPSDITEIIFLNKGEPAPTTYDSTWELPKSFGLVAYRVGSKVYIHRSNDLELYLPTNIRYLFSNPDPALKFSSLEKIVNLTSLNAIVVDDADYMFDGASSLSEIDLSNFFTETLRNTRYMFANCSNLTTIKASNIFTLDEVESRCENMFDGCISLVGKDSSGNEGTGTYSRYSESNPKDTTCAKIEENYGDNHGYLTDGNYTINIDWNKDTNDNVIINKANVTKITFKKGGDEPSTYDNTYFIKGGNGLEGYIVNGTDLIIYARNGRRTIYLTRNAKNIFKDTTSLTAIDSFKNVSTEKTVDMTGLFHNAKSLTSIDLSNFNTNRVASMSYIFCGMNSLTSLDLSRFNTSLIEDMSHMFEGAASLTSLDVSSFDTSHVTDMSYMFKSMTNLQNIDLSTFVVSQIPKLEGMFAEMDSIEFIDLSTFTGGLPDDPFSFNNTYKMFEGCDNLKIIDITYFSANWDADAGYMFINLPELTTIHCKYNWSSAKSGTLVFYNCPKLVGGEGTSYAARGQQDKTYARPDKYEGDPSRLGYFTAPVCRLTRGWYVGSGLNPEEITSVTIHNYDPGYSGPIYDIPYSNGLKGRKVDGGTDISIFPAESGRGITLGSSAAYLFSDETHKFTSLTSVTGFEHVYSGNLVTTSHMFDGASSLTNVDLTSLDVKNVTNMSYMFNGTSALTNIIMSSFDVKNVSDMSYMFSEASSLTELDFTNYDTRSLINTSYMFKGCTNLATIKVTDDFDMSGVLYSENMFDACTSLLGKDIDRLDGEGEYSRYNDSNPKDKTLAIVEENCYGHHGYFSDYNYRFKPGWYYADGTIDNPDSPENISKIIFASTSSAEPTTYDHTWDIYNSNGLKGYRQGNTVTIYAPTTRTIYASKNSLRLFANSTYMSPNFNKSFGWSCGGVEFENLYMLNTSKVQDFFGAFKYVEFKPGTVSFETFDTSRVTNFSNMFGEGPLIVSNTDVPSPPGAELFGHNENVDLDISSFNTSSASNLTAMFNNAGFKSIKYSDKFINSSARSIKSMFAYAYNIDSIDVSGFDITSLDGNGIEYLFLGCKKLVELNLSTMDTRSIGSYEGLFVNCENLERIYVSTKWKEISGVSHNVFTGCYKLAGDAGSTKASISEITSEYESNSDRFARVDCGIENADWAGLFSDTSYVLRPGWYKYLNSSHNYNTRSLTSIKFVPYGEAIMSNPDYDCELPDSFGLRACRKGGDVEIYGYENNGIRAAENSKALFSDVDKYEESTWVNDYGMREVTVIENLNLLDTTKVRNMEGMFAGLGRVKTLDLSNFDTRKVTRMNFMFYEMYYVSSLDLSSFDTSKVGNMYAMFHGDGYLSYLNLSSFDTSNVTTMRNMFYAIATNISYAHIIGLNRFNTSKVRDMAEMFEYSHIYGEDLDLTSFDTSNVEDMQFMFAASVTDNRELDLTSFNVSKNRRFDYMFQWSGYRTIYASDAFRLNYYVNPYSEYMFAYTNYLVGEKGFRGQGGDGQRARIDGTDGMPGYFTRSRYVLAPNWYENLQHANLNNVKKIIITTHEQAPPTTYIEKVKAKNGYGLEVYCYMDGSDEVLEIHAPEDKAIHLYYKPEYLFSGDTSDKKLQSLTTIENFDKVGTYLTTSTAHMFDGASSLQSIDLTNLDTREVTNMSNMFDGASSLQEIDLMNFETAAVTDMSYMFNNCSQLTTIKATDDFDVSNVTDSDDMFSGCTNLSGKSISREVITNFDPSKVDKSMAVIEENNDLHHGYLSDCNYAFAGDINNWSETAIGLDSRNITKLTFTHDEKDIPTSVEASGTRDEFNGLMMYKTNGTEVVLYAKKSRPIYTRNSANNLFGTHLRSLNEVVNIDILDTSKSTTAEYMFENWHAGTVSVCDFEFKNLTSTYAMFKDAQLDKFDFNGVNFESLENARAMFSRQSTGAYTQIDEFSIIGINFGANIKYVSDMFAGRKEIRTVILSDVLNGVLEADGMFKDCELFEELDLSDWNISSVSNMQEIFKNCTNLKSIYVLDKFDVTNVTSDTDMFDNCAVLEGGCGTKYSDVISTDPSHAKDKTYACIDYGPASTEMGYLTYKVYQFDENWYQDTTFPSTGIREITILRNGENPPTDYSSMWNIPNSRGLIGYRKGDNAYIYAPNNMDIYTAANASNLFGTNPYPKFSSVEKINNFEYVNTSMTNDMSHMFDSCFNLKSVNLLYMNTSRVTDMSYMFNYVQKIDKLSLNSFDTANVTNMSNMFANCEALTTIYVTAKFATASVVFDSDMFSACDKLVGENGTTRAKIAEIDPSHVDDMTYACIDTDTSLGYFTYKDAPPPVPPTPPTPTPTPPYTPSGGGERSGGGGGGGRGTGGPLVNKEPQKISVNTVKTIKDSFASTNCQWIYEPVNDKWKLQYINGEGHTLAANAGFYVITRLVDREYISPTVVGNLSVSTYYFDEQGYMYTGYIVTALDNKTYYFDTSTTMTEGAMKIGWVKIMNNWYYFGIDGAMFINAVTPDGYIVGADGKWVEK